MAQTGAKGWTPTKQELELGEQLAEFGLSFVMAQTDAQADAEWAPTKEELELGE